MGKHSKMHNHEQISFLGIGRHNNSGSQMEDKIWTWSQRTAIQSWILELSKISIFITTRLFWRLQLWITAPAHRIRTIYRSNPLRAREIVDLARVTIHKLISCRNHLLKTQWTIWKIREGWVFLKMFFWKKLELNRFRSNLRARVKVCQKIRACNNCIVWIHKSQSNTGT